MRSRTFLLFLLIGQKIDRLRKEERMIMMILGYKAKFAKANLKCNIKVYLWNWGPKSIWEDGPIFISLKNQLIVPIFEIR